MDFIKSNVVVCLIQECSGPDLEKRIIEIATAQTQGKRACLLVWSVGLLVAVTSSQGRKVQQQLKRAQAVESDPS